jgi:hypothetical protein
VVHDIKQLGAKGDDKQLKYRTHIKYKSTQDPHAPQVKQMLYHKSQIRNPSHMHLKIISMPIMC